MIHAYADFLQTPRGALERQPSDPENFSIHPIGISRPFQKHNFLRRRFQEREYGRNVAVLINRLRPDWVISGNTPTEAQALLLAASHRSGARFVSWVQDFYGIAVDRLLRSRLPGIGHCIGGYYRYLERRVLQQSDRIVLITEDFRPLVAAMGISDDRIRVIENWAPIDELPLRPKRNAWSEAQGLADKFVFLYSGTLGMKHNPELLLRLAERFSNDREVRVVVISEGPGIEWLQDRAIQRGMHNLVLMPFQPFERMPEVLGAADVLVAILEPDAGVFSVPSKVLTYLCAGKPLLAAMPTKNLAARTIERAGAGVVIATHDAPAFVSAGDRLLACAESQPPLGHNARTYAERVFDIEEITNAFEELIA